MRTHPRDCSFLLALLCASIPVAAQRPIVSPAGVAASDGNATNPYPSWGNPVQWTPRYLQIHSDLGPTPSVLRQLALRLESRSLNVAGPLLLDIELYMGNSVSWDRASWVYANNYTVPPTNVVARMYVNLQNLTGIANPNPFDAKFPFTTPFLYLPPSHVAWEMRVHSATGSMNGSWDAHAGWPGTGGGDAIFGTGCTASGQNFTMLLGGGSGSWGGVFTIGSYVDRGPAYAPTVLALGASNPSLKIPGLCGTLYTDLQVTLPMGLTDAIGFLGETVKWCGGANVLACTSVLPGSTLYLQAHSLDPLRADPIQVANSNGRSVKVPLPGLGPVVQATRIYGFNQGLGVANPNAHYVTSGIGYAVVVEFS